MTVIESQQSKRKRQFRHNVRVMGGTVNADGRSLIGDELSQLVVSYFWASECPLIYHRLAIRYITSLEPHSRYPKRIPLYGELCPQG
jgi:hypothetical protein